MNDVRELIPAQQEIQMIPIDRTPVNEPYRTELIRHKRKRRNRCIRGIEMVAAVSMMLNAIQSVIIYILQVGPI